MMNIALNGLKIRLEEAEMGGTLHTSGGEHTQGGTQKLLEGFFLV